MGQHYIPKFYLDGFTDLSSKIYQYEKGSKEILPTSTKSVANENHRWPQKIENYLSSQVEGPANPIISKIRNREIITQQEKETLSTYMVVMLKRVPRGLERAREQAPKVIESVFSNLKDDIIRLIREHPSKTDKLQKILQELPNLKTKYENSFPMEVWYKNILPDTSTKLHMIVPAMTWTFLISDRQQPFITNDNPIFFFESIGIGKQESEITFPISNSIALWATWRTNVKEGYVVASNTVIREFNRRIASSATRYVYYSQKEPWVINLINRKNPRLNRLS